MGYFIRSGVVSVTMFLTTAGLLVSPAFAGPIKPPVATSFSGFDTQIDGKWRADSGSLYSAFRSNGPHYWNWLKVVAASTDLFKPQGLVIGDPHVMNLADIRMKDGSNEFGLVDADDSGLGSLLGDYLRFYIGNNISPYEVEKGKQLFLAYVAGLRGEVRPAPEFWNKIKAIGEKQFAVDQQKYIQGQLKKDGQSFKDSTGILPLEQAPEAIKAAFVEIENAINEELRGMQVVKKGFKVKAGGGSQNMPRFVYLLKAADQSTHIWEFKVLQDSAVSLYAHQPQEVGGDVLKIYRPQGEVLGPYKFLRAGKYNILLREKLESYIHFSQERNESPLEVADAQEMSFYIANRMGLWQSQQKEAGDLIRIININPDAVFENLKSLKQSYVSLMKVEHGKR